MKKLLSVFVLGLSCLATPSWAEVVNLNTASATSLADNLYGIGDKKAAAIIAYRKQYGAFQSLEQIKEVKGIGEGLLKRNKQDMTLGKQAATRSTIAPQVAKPAKSKVKKTQSSTSSAKPLKSKVKPKDKASHSDKDKKVKLNQSSPKDKS